MVQKKESDQDDCRFASLACKADGKRFFQVRNETKKDIASGTISITAGNYDWMKLIRMGDSFTSYLSEDGETWEELGTHVIPNANELMYVGLWVNSNRDDSMTTATFEDVSINQWDEFEDSFEIPNLSLLWVDSQEGNSGVKAIDDNPNTFWHSKWSGTADPKPHEVQIDLAGTHTVGALTYLPRQDGNLNGTITDYKVLVSPNGTTWTEVAAGTWAYDATEKTVTFPEQSNVSYIALRDVGWGNWSSAAEINVIGTGTEPPSPVELSLLWVDSQEGNSGANAIDGNMNSFWHSKWSGTADPKPHEIQIDLNGSYTINGLTYLPRQDGSLNGTITDYKVLVSPNGTTWTEVAAGTWVYDATEKTITFPEQSNVSYIALRDVGWGNWSSAAEIGVLTE